MIYNIKISKNTQSTKIFWHKNKKSETKNNKGTQNKLLLQSQYGNFN